jgi:hypothetical protein
MQSSRWSSRLAPGARVMMRTFGKRVSRSWGTHIPSGRGILSSRTPSIRASHGNGQIRFERRCNVTCIPATIDRVDRRGNEGPSLTPLPKL